MSLFRSLDRTTQAATHCSNTLRPIVFQPNGSFRALKENGKLAVGPEEADLYKGRIKNPLAETAYHLPYGQANKLQQSEMRAGTEQAGIGGLRSARGFAVVAARGPNSRLSQRLELDAIDLVDQPLTFSSLLPVCPSVRPSARLCSSACVCSGYTGFVRGSQHISGRTFGETSRRALCTDYREVVSSSPIPSAPQANRKIRHEDLRDTFVANMFGGKTYQIPGVSARLRLERRRTDGRTGDRASERAGECSVDPRARLRSQLTFDYFSHPAVV